VSKRVRAIATQATPALPNVAMQLTEFRQHVSPLPAPNDLVQYEQIRPGTAERMLSAWESESTHRRQRESTEQSHRHRRDWWSLAANVLISLSGVGGAVFCGSRGYEWAAVAIVGAVFGVGAASILRRPPPAP
jgi:uncharacterized membrane protein